MNIIKIMLYRFIGRDPKVEKRIEEKRTEAHDIINESMAQVWETKKSVDKINIQTSKKLDKVSKRLEDISYQIGLASGGAKRGLETNGQ
jgi:hypothetical protein